MGPVLSNRFLYSTIIVVPGCVVVDNGWFSYPIVSKGKETKDDTPYVYFNNGFMGIGTRKSGSGGCFDSR